jgi:hypothetical protein
VQWQPTPVAKTTEGADFNQPPYVHRYFSAQVTFHFILAVNDLSQFIHLLIRKVSDSGFRVAIYIGLLQYSLGQEGSDTVYASESDIHSLAIRYIYARYTNHIPSLLLTLPLGMPGIRADNAHRPLALDNSAFVAAWLY